MAATAGKVAAELENIAEDPLDSESGESSGARRRAVFGGALVFGENTVKRGMRLYDYSRVSFLYVLAIEKAAIRLGRVKDGGSGFARGGKRAATLWLPKKWRWESSIRFWECRERTIQCAGGARR